MPTIKLRTLSRGLTAYAKTLGSAERGLMADALLDAYNAIVGLPEGREHACENCGVLFASEPYRKYCDRACAREHQITKQPVVEHVHPRGGQDSNAERRRG